MSEHKYSVGSPVYVYPNPVRRGQRRSMDEMRAERQRHVVKRVAKTFVVVEVDGEDVKFRTRATAGRPARSGRHEYRAGVQSAWTEIGDGSRRIECALGTDRRETEADALRILDDIRNRLRTLPPEELSALRDRLGQLIDPWYTAPVSIHQVE